MSPGEARTIHLAVTPAGIPTTPKGAGDTRPGNFFGLPPHYQHWLVIIGSNDERNGTVFELNRPDGGIGVLVRSEQQRESEELENSTVLRAKKLDVTTSLSDEEINRIASDICQTNLKGEYDLVNGNCQTMANSLISEIATEGTYVNHQTMSHVLGSLRWDEEEVDKYGGPHNRFSSPFDETQMDFRMIISYGSNGESVVFDGVENPYSRRSSADDSSQRQEPEEWDDRVAHPSWGSRNDYTVPFGGIETPAPRSSNEDEEYAYGTANSSPLAQADSSQRQEPEEWDDRVAHPSWGSRNDYAVPFGGTETPWSSDEYEEPAASSDNGSSGVPDPGDPFWLH
ncbi:unnamed protein product [Clonostachys byssicola]|uniref:Uncharacterized protein n=1 Tax=Clonostachys byssicola TaxID=160290 RepID=A0A9N9XZE9_9HYPO|nr:unnamed protein product [Clonostachys byssicola]